MVQSRGPTVLPSITCAVMAALLSAAPSAHAEAPAPLLKPIENGDETYTESFVAIADLADGTYVKVQVGVSNAGAGDGKGACRLLVAAPARPAVAKAAVFERNSWRWTEAPRPKLAMGEACEISAGPDALSVRAGLESVQLELTIQGSASASRRPVHSAKSSGGFYDLEVLIPWGAARAIITEPGEKPRTVQGFGYADHSRANALPKKTAKQWVRFRALSRDASQIFLVRFPPDDRRFEGWRWAQPAPAPASLTRVAATPNRTDAKAQAWRVMLDGEGGPWRIISKTLIQRDAPLEESGAGGLLGSLIGNPVTYTYRATLESKHHPGPVQGLLEVTLTDE